MTWLQRECVKTQLYNNSLRHNRQFTSRQITFRTTLYNRTHLPRVVMCALLLQPCMRVARARCARGTRCWLARGDSSPYPSPRALYIRARAAGFHCSCHSLCWSSHSAGLLCVSASLYLSASSLAERLVSAFISSLASASARSSFGFIYNGGIWTTSNFSKSDYSVVLALV